MSKIAKLIVFLIFLFSAAAAYLTVVLIQKMEQEKKQRVFVEGELQKTEVKLTQTEKEKVEISKKLEEVVEVKQQIQVERDKAKEEAARLSQELEKEKKEKDDLQKKLEQKEQSALELMKQLQDEKTARQEVSEKYEQIQRDASSSSSELLSRLQKAQEERAMLTKKLRELSGGQDSGQQPVKIKDILVQANQKFSGSILTVNKQFNFVIVDIGQSDGILPGTELIVHRGKKLVGKIKIEKVYDKMSAATLIPKWMQDEIKEDDSVKKF